MVATLLLCIAGGAAMTLAVSRSDHVTLSWLRLGAIIALCLTAVAAVTVQVVGGEWTGQISASFVIGGSAMIAHLMLVQLGRRAALRLLALAGAAGCVAAATLLAQQSVRGEGVFVQHPAGFALLAGAMVLSSGLLGGFVMAMLLGHAYLTAANEMTQQPFARLVIFLGVLLVLRFILSGVAWWLWRGQDAEQARGLMQQMYVLARFVVGLGGPLVFTAMAWDCVRRRANQSATGILYVAIIPVIIGEGVAMVLLDATGYAF